MTRVIAPRERLVDYAFGVGWAVSRRAPEPVAARVLEGAADRVFRQRGHGVAQLEANLRRAAPGLSPAEVDNLTHQAVHSYFRYWHEALRLPSWSDRRICDTVVTTGEQPLRTAFAAGRGAIVALPHMANWDLAGAWACLTGMPVTAVAERLRPESLFERFVRYREGLGMEVIALSGAENPLPALRSALNRGRLVCLVADREINGGGVEIDLLGEAARMPGGPAVLARRTKAPLFAATLSFHGPLMQIDFSEQVEVRAGADGPVQMTQQVADWFSAGIRRHPADWHMLQPIFAADVGR